MNEPEPEFRLQHIHEHDTENLPRGVVLATKLGMVERDDGVKCVILKLMLRIVGDNKAVPSGTDCETPTIIMTPSQARDHGTQLIKFADMIEASTRAREEARTGGKA